MNNKMFDVVHNVRDRRDFAELVCEIIVYVMHCDVDDSERIPLPNIVRKIGRNIPRHNLAKLADFPYPQIMGIQYPDEAMNKVFSRIVSNHISEKDNEGKLLTLNGYVITFHVSAEPNNAITVQNDGLHVNISGKADKVSNSTNGNLAGLDANGNLVDSGIAKANILQTSNVATDAEMTEVLTEVFGE